MINSNIIKSLFKPYKMANDGLSLYDYLVEQVGLRKFWKIQFEDECSKSIDESCINIECPYNYLRMHKDELYIDIMQEIQDERRELEKRVERDRKKYGYI